MQNKNYCFLSLMIISVPLLSMNCRKYNPIADRYEIRSKKGRKQKEKAEEIASFEYGQKLNKLAWPYNPDNFPLIEQFLLAGANPNVNVDQDLEECLLHKLARDDKYHPLVALLLKFPINARKTNIGDMTPLHHAAAGGAVKNTLLLLQERIPINPCDSAGDTPLHLVAVSVQKTPPTSYRKYVEIVKLLIDAGADLKLINHSQETPIDLFMQGQAQQLPLGEFDCLLRKKIGQNFLATLNTLKQHNKCSYLAKLPVELIELIALFATDEEYKAKPQIISGFPGDI